MLSLRTSPAFTGQVVMQMRDEDQASKFASALKEHMIKQEYVDPKVRKTQFEAKNKNVVINNPETTAGGVRNFMYDVIRDAFYANEKNFPINYQEMNFYRTGGGCNSKLVIPRDKKLDKEG